MTACADWVAAQFLRDRGLEFPNPPCAHDPADCPPLRAAGARTEETADA